MRDALFIGLVQCIALIPGVSRSGATISAGLFRGLDRVTATRLSFFLAIPALTAAGLFELEGRRHRGRRLGPDPGRDGGRRSSSRYASIAWLLRFVAKHPITVFVWYRVALALVTAILLVTGVLTATG